MKKGEVLILTREDLIESSKTNLDITISDIENDNTEIRASDIILFLDDNSEAKILKNRYGNNGTIIQKVYNISLSNPLGNYTTLNKVFEDSLPGDPNSYTALTIYERLQLVNHIRNIMLINCDGEEMTISGSDNSLLSYVKLMDLNPYNICKKNRF